MIELLKTMIEASKAATLPLDMKGCNYGTSYCLYEDVVVYENPTCSSDPAILRKLTNEFSRRLSSKSMEEFGSDYVSSSISVSIAWMRHEYAEYSGIFTDEELEHPHLTTDHCDRAIAIDYIELVIRKCEDRLNAKNSTK